MTNGRKQIRKAKKKSIIFRKLSVRDLFNSIGINENWKVAYPVYEEGMEIFKKISGDFEAVVRQPRNLGHHRKIFAVFQKVLKNYNIYDLFKDEIDPLIIRKIHFKLKKPMDVLVYLLKWKYLPLHEEFLPTGEKVYIVSSISFMAMDELIFSEFYDQAVNCLANKTGIKREVLEDEG